MDSIGSYPFWNSAATPPNVEVEAEGDCAGQENCPNRARRYEHGSMTEASATEHHGAIPLRRFVSHHIYRNMICNAF
jgi:hypothetical protein